MSRVVAPVKIDHPALGATPPTRQRKLEIALLISAFAAPFKILESVTIAGVLFAGSDGPDEFL